jgi:AcrR family transcriptional regulator
MATARPTDADRSARSVRKTARAPGQTRPQNGKRSERRSQVDPKDGGLRRVLIDVALELVEVSGTRGLSWREIARRANVSHTAPYRHFANKEELLAAVAEQGFRSLTERMTAEMARARDDVARRFEAMAIAYVEFAAENPAHFRVMFGRDVPDFSKHAGLREAHDVTDGLFRAGVADVLKQAGEIGVEIDVDHFALMAWSLVHGLASLTVDGRVGDVGEAGVDPGEQVRSLTSLLERFVDAIRA